MIDKVILVRCVSCVGEGRSWLVRDVGSSIWYQNCDWCGRRVIIPEMVQKSQE